MAFFGRLTNLNVALEDRHLDLHTVDGWQSGFLRETEMLSFATVQDDRRAILQHGGFWSAHTLDFKEFDIRCVVLGRGNETVFDIDQRIKRVLQVGTAEPLRLEVLFGSKDVPRYIEVRPVSFRSTVGPGSAGAPYVDFSARLRAVSPWWQSVVERSAALTIGHPLETRNYTPTSPAGIEFTESIGQVRIGMNWSHDPGERAGLDFVFYEGLRLGGAGNTTVDVLRRVVDGFGTMSVTPAIEISTPATATETNSVTVFIEGAPPINGTVNSARFTNLPAGATTVFDPEDLSVTSVAGNTETNLLGNWAGNAGGARIVPILPAGRSTFTVEWSGTESGTTNMVGVRVALRWRDRWH